VPISANANPALSIPVVVAKFGDGCPSGQFESVFNGDTLSVSFSSFEAVAPIGSVVSKTCNLVLTTVIPSGVRLQPLRVYYIGFADVPFGGTATIVFNALVHDQLFAAQNRVFPPGFSSQFEVKLNAKPQVIDACKGPVPTAFALNTNLVAASLFSFGPATPTQIRLDTVDVTGGSIMQIKFAVSSCSDW
jgi:hypothetical protein